MIRIDRQTLIRQLTEFLTGAGNRPRALLLLGGPGMGKSNLLDLIQAALLGGADQGRTVIAIDDGDNLSDARIEQVRVRLEADPRARLLVTGRSLPDGLVRMVERTCERRLVDVPALCEDEARIVLADVGIAPWSLHAAQAIRRTGCIPRALVDEVFAHVDLAGLVALDSSFTSGEWPQIAAHRLELTLRGEVEALEELVSACEESDSPDAIIVRAEMALLDGDLEGCVQLGERVAFAGAATPVGAWANLMASTARALRGEPTALLSLHAQAGSASRAKSAHLECLIWQHIAWVSGVIGDATTAQRSAIRGIELADEIGATTLGMCARNNVAEQLLAGSESARAVPYLREIAEVADAFGHHAFRVDALTNLARAQLALGDQSASCQAAEAAVDLASRGHVSQRVLVTVQVQAARSYRAAGSMPLALGVLGDVERIRADSLSGGPGFWIALEAIRMHASWGQDPAMLSRWQEALFGYPADGHHHVMRAAHAEADAWGAAARGRRAEAARLAQRARSLWTEAGRRDELAQSDTLLHHAPLEMGPRFQLVATQAGDPTAFNALTPREREIARYVAGGLTNPEIARELHLSPRTVEHHVGSILRKLELPSRRALVLGQV